MTLKTARFSSPIELCAFVNKPANNVVTIVQIVTDGNGHQVLYYKES